MRLLLISVAATALVAASAIAQPDHDHGHGGGGPAPAAHGGPPHGGPAGGPPHGGAPGGGPGGFHGPQGGPPPAPHAAPAAPAFSRGPNGGGGARPPAPANAPAFTRGPNGGGGFDHSRAAPNAPARDVNRPGPGPGGFNHGAANRGAGPGAGRHNFSGFTDFHQNFNAARRFHAPAYRQPQGWYSHHWVYGETLPSLFWGRTYWLTDYVDYALPPPPYGAVWVRVGSDALLIDEDSGEIITVEYGVFY